jgi:E3 ubiquitin-protein ligase SHPRH
MGLGKTVELLGCILANPNKKALKLDSVKAAKIVQAKLDSRKCDRVDCTCGATHEDPSYDGSWIQCDICDAWQHALCVGYIAPPDVEANLQRIAAQGLQPNKRSDNKIQLGVTISPDLKYRCLFTVMQVSLILQKDINSRISVQFRS